MVILLYTVNTFTLLTGLRSFCLNFIALSPTSCCDLGSCTNIIESVPSDDFLIFPHCGDSQFLHPTRQTNEYFM